MQGPVDWTRFIDLANQHKVMPLAQRNVVENWPAGKDIPSRVTINRWLGKIRARTDAAYAEMTALTETFRENGVEVLWFKGPILTEVAYGDRGLRELWDIDFLYRRPDRLRVDAALTARGHDCITIIEEHQRRPYEHYHFAYLYKRDDPHSEVDAHFALMPRAWSPIEQAGLWDRATELTIDGVAVKTFSPEDMALYLALHAGKEQWSRLRMVCDLAFWLDAHPDLDWNAMFRRAESWGASRVLRLGLLLASDWMGAHVPEDALRQARADSIAVSCEALIRRRFWSATKTRKTAAARLTRYHLALLDRNRDRASYILSFIFTPRLLHLQLVKIPASLAVLYVPVKLLHDYVALPLWLLTRPLTRRFSGSRPEEESA